MDGIVLIDKPKNITSRDVVNVICKKYNTKKVGHTGTLDPLATGVLVICIGRATKLVELLTSTEKEYVAGITLGIKTDTGDITGKIISSSKINNINKEQINEALNKIKGKYMQEVPIYSAVKVNGKKLYEYARCNEKVILPKKEVEIKKIELISEPILKDNRLNFNIKCTVSKGTYIRSLVNDIASLLNTYGTMNSLKRIKQGIFDINDCQTLDEELKIIPIKQALSFLPIYKINSDLEFKVSNGVKLPISTFKEEVVLLEGKKTLCIYKKEENQFKMYKKIN